VAWNHQGQRVGRPHVAAWAETEIALAANLGDGTDDPRATAPGLLRRALAVLPPRARASGRVAMRADAGYFAGQLARAAHDERIVFAIGAKRSASLRRLLVGLADDWHDAMEMDNAQVAVAGYCPDWWPANTRLLIRRVALDPGQVSADPRSRRRRTLHPDQRALPIPGLAAASPVYAYSFILTNLDVSSPDKAAAAEHWYGTAPRWRTSSATASSALPSGISHGIIRCERHLAGLCRHRAQPAPRGRRPGQPGLRQGPRRHHPPRPDRRGRPHRKERPRPSHSAPA
jgi:hypothetical protein